MRPDLRLIRYFVTVADEGNITRAAIRLHISQPALSAAVKELEAQMGVELLARRGRRFELTAAGELLRGRGQALLDHADAVYQEVIDRSGTGAARISLGVSPAARFGVAPDLLSACASRVPALMIYTREDTTGALMRAVAAGRLDMALTFCARPAPGIVLAPLREEPVVMHLRDDHPLARRESIELSEVAGETVLVAADEDSSGFTERVLAAFERAGITPAVRADPYPDLGLQAVREGLGIVLYTRRAFPAALEGSAFVQVDPPPELPFHLAVRAGRPSAAVRSVLEIARSADV